MIPDNATDCGAETSEESKQHSKEVLEQEFNGGNIEKDGGGEKNPQNVAGGLKAYVPVVSSLAYRTWLLKKRSVQYDQEPQRVRRG